MILIINLVLYFLGLEFDIPKDANEFCYTVFEFWKDIGLTCNIYVSFIKSKMTLINISNTNILAVQNYVSKI